MVGLFQGKSENKMDEDWGYPHFRKPPYTYIYTLWLFNIAIENCPFMDGLLIKNGDFPWLC